MTRDELQQLVADVQEIDQMIQALDTVVLAVDLPEHNLNAGDLGTVVLVHSVGGYEVEFMTPDGETVAVVSLAPEQVRSINRGDIAKRRYQTTCTCSCVNQAAYSSAC